MSRKVCEELARKHLFVMDCGERAAIAVISREGRAQPGQYPKAIVRSLEERGLIVRSKAYPGAGWLPWYPTRVGDFAGQLARVRGQMHLPFGRSDA